MSDLDIAYFMKRARQERERAKLSADLSGAHAHLRMAEAYEARLRDNMVEAYLAA